MGDSDDEMGFGYSSEDLEDSSEDESVELQNLYYTAKTDKLENIQRAIEGFEQVLVCENGNKCEWGFKALKQLIKLHFSAHNYEVMLQKYENLLTYVKSAVTKNYSEKSINSILDRVSIAHEHELLQRFYTLTLATLKESKNDRLWFKTNLKLGKLYFDSGDYMKLLKILKELHASCTNQKGDDDLSKGTQLLEIYALEIQMYTEQQNNKKLKNLYEKCLYIKSAIPHPLIMGIIRECGGKMHLREGEFDKAYQDFFEAFKNYEESGSNRRTACLKYLVLANMLTKSDINPFESQETKPYKADPEVQIMTQLVAAYQDSNIKDFERIVRDNYDSIMADTFIKEHLEELLSNVRSEVLLKLLKAYSKIKISYIASQLKISIEEAEELLESLIQDNRLKGRIHQVEGIVEIIQNENSFVEWGGLFTWCKHLKTLHHQSLVNMNKNQSPFCGMV